MCFIVENQCLKAIIVGVREVGEPQQIRGLSGWAYSSQVPSEEKNDKKRKSLLKYIRLSRSLSL